MGKISYNDFVKNITMFFLNESIDVKYMTLRQDKVELLKKQMSSINSREGLEAYIRKYDDSLDNLLVILGVSTELFKRVTSLFRIQRGMTFSTEWDVPRTRRYALTDEPFMDKLCNLFLSLPDESISANIPEYRLRNFVINDKIMQRLNNDDFLDFLVGKDFDTNYNSEISAINSNKVESLLKDICSQQNLYLNITPTVDPVGNNTRNILVNYTVSSAQGKLPMFYIKTSFILTTSKGQSDFKRSVQDLRNYIRNKNETAKQITIIDGAGWIGRQSDLRDVWDYSDFSLNLKTLNKLTEIIK